MHIRKRIPRDTPFADRFWMYVTPSEPDQCWRWEGSVNASGYGQMTVKGVHWPAHKASYLLNRGEIGPLNVCHTCDIRSCVNPNHLYLATQSQNMKDAVSRGRLPLVIQQIQRGQLTKLKQGLKLKATLDRLRKRIQRVVGPIEITDQQLERFYEGDEPGTFTKGNTLYANRERDSMGRFL